MKFKLFLLLIIPLFISSLNAQFYFGKNKIQYTDYQWEVLKTEHFNVYFFQEEHEIATVAAQMAERAFSELVYNFDYIVNRPIPLIIYSSPNLFQETNTVPFILPEGVGGFTEFYKGRVVLPFNGSYYDFYHVIKHELVHVFTLYKIQYILDTHDIFFFEFPPLWFMEGLAEYWSLEDRTENETIMKATVLEENLVPIMEIDRISGSFLMYKEGENFLDFLEENYGRGRIIFLFDNWWKSKNFYYAFEEAMGVSLEEADEQWCYQLKKKYYPLLSQGNLPEIAAHKLTDTGLNLSPVVWPRDSGYEIIFKADRMGYTGLYRMDAEENTRLVMKGEMKEPLESLHLFRNKISLSKDGLMAFSAKSEGSDNLYLFDLNKGKIVFKKKFKDLTSIISPALSGDGSSVVFTGMDLSGKADLYLFDRVGDSLIRLTNDYYDDKNPCWLDGQHDVLFVSDRVVNGRRGRYGLYSININTKAIMEFGLPEGNTIFPSVSSGGDGIVFAADYDTSYQLYLIRNNRLYKITNILTGVYEGSWITADSLVVSAYTNNSYQLFKLDIPDTLESMGEVPLLPWNSSWHYKEQEGETEISQVEYDKKLKLDIAQGAVSTQTGMEAGGGLEGVMTDMLGDHQLYFLVYNQAQELSEVLRNFNFILSYYNVKKRFNWGGGAYHLYYKDYNRIEGTFEEENSGFIGALSYPLSRFHRMDAKLYIQHARKKYVYADTRFKGWQANFLLSYIRDNAIWESVGPIEGMRLNLTGGLTADLQGLRMLSYLYSADLRYYLRVSRRTSLAFRIIGRYSGGDLPERFYMGGTWSFRGYPWFYFFGKKNLLFNAEYRFPLIDRLILGLPFGRVDLSSVKGALFFDAGQAWEDEPMELVGSFGVSFRMSLGGYIVLRSDIAKRTDFQTINDDTYFDIFFGWNY
ncbi:BamA/TamA family outer membrane protein [bacterium]|nr:BamA/TamA family outer membrane protein [bacterium]